MLKIFMIFVEHSSLPGRLEINLGIQYYLSLTRAESVLLNRVSRLDPAQKS